MGFIRRFAERRANYERFAATLLAYGATEAQLREIDTLITHIQEWSETSVYTVDELSTVTIALARAVITRDGATAPEYPNAPRLGGKPAQQS